MKKLIISLMPLIFFIGCEDEDGTAAEGEKPAAEGDKKEGEDKKPAEEKK